MRDSTIYRILIAIAVIFAIVVIISLWQVWLVLGLAYLIYVYAYDRGVKFPKTYAVITAPFKLLSNRK